MNKKWLLIAMLPVCIVSGCASHQASNAVSSSGQQSRLECPRGIYPEACSNLDSARGYFVARQFVEAAQAYRSAGAMFRALPSIESEWLVRSLVGEAASYDEIRRFDLADAVYQDLRVHAGETFVYWNNLGYSHLLRGDKQNALLYFRKALAINPADKTLNENMKIALQP